MKCSKCLLNNRESARYCKKCGSELKLHCPACGYACKSDSLFCDECGYGLRKQKATASADYSQPKSYTPKFLADKILNIRSNIEGERKVVTVLFADIANYTAISEKLDPEEVHQMMDGCFRILTNEIHKYEGTINQFTGDGIMALFGAPIARENHAQRACYAALSVRRAMEDYGKQIMADYGLEFKMRFGLNSGPVIVGSIGDDLRMDYTAVGDTTNLAKRMESIATPGSVILAENTFRLVKSFFMIKKGQSDSEIKKNIKEKVTTLNKEFSPPILSAIQQLLSLEIDNDSWQNLEPVQRRKYIFDALNSLLIRLSEEKPLIIVVDDLQWIDRTSVDFLSNFKDLS